MVNDTNATNPTSTNELLAEISDYWANYQGSSIWNLMDVFNSPLTSLSGDAKKVGEWRTVKDAQGATLDILGQDRKAYRTSDEDNLYRFLIYIRFLISRAQGTPPSILEISETALQKDKGFKIFKTKTRHIVIKIPFNQIDDLGTEKLILNNLQQLVALGIWLEGISFEIQTAATDYIGAATMASEHVRLVAETKTTVNITAHTTDYLGATAVASEHAKLVAKTKTVINVQASTTDYLGAASLAAERVKITEKEKGK